jgi:hypothetical protein
MFLSNIPSFPFGIKPSYLWISVSLVVGLSACQESKFSLRPTILVDGDIVRPPGFSCADTDARILVNVTTQVLTLCKDHVEIASDSVTIGIGRVTNADLSTRTWYFQGC